MKRAFLFAAMLAMAASCSVSEVDSIKETTAPEIIASYENNGTKTTITIDSEGVGTIWWKPADEINIFYGNTSTHYTSKNKENATTVAFGTTDIIGSTETSSKNIWGLYPYDEDAECDGTSVSTRVSAMQKGVAETFDDDLFTSLAHSTSTVMTFYNVLGGIKFSLSRDDIKKITFKGNNNENIAGKVKLKMDANGKPVAEVTGGEKAITITPKEGATFAKNTYYYLVMLPTVLSEGFTMTFDTGTEIGTFEYKEKSVEIKRSVFSKKENIDSYATFEGEDDATNPFTITSVGSTSVSISKVGTPYDITLQYRKGTGSWSAYTIGNSIDLGDGEFVQFRAGDGGNEYFSSNISNYYKVVVSGSGTVKASGNIMSLLDKTEERTTMPGYGYTFLFNDCNKLVDASKLELPATTLDVWCYYGMFSNCTSLQTAPELPATTLADGCYEFMFEDCTSLVTAPELLATTLADGCYVFMFYGCTSLQTAPNLPATTLADYCYNGMFYGCTSLQTAPELPATTLADGCYGGMFYGCTSLVTAPELPATTLANNCYCQMFEGCTSLQTAPELPATTLADSCYGSMFYGCTSLVTAPELPATNLAIQCYDRMFYGCSSLVTAPELPATTLDGWCYYGMFYGCTSLVTAPELPATTLDGLCYKFMFYGCTSLVTAPELPATTLANMCYNSMFYGCSKLNYVKALFETTPSGTYTQNWLDGVSSTGTFVKSKNASWDVTGPNGIPEGWTVQIFGETSITLDKTEVALEVGETVTLTATVSPADATITWSSSDESIATVKDGVVTAIGAGAATITAKAGDKTATCAVTVTDGGTTNPFTITSVGSTSVSISKEGSPDEITLEYRKGKGSWSAYTIGTSIDLGDGEFVQFRAGKGGNGNFSKSYSDYYHVVVSGNGTVKASGNIMSLLDKTEERTTMPGYGYIFLFYDCNKLVDASKLELPATNLAERCYYSMFYDCTSLVNAPELPATNLAERCYYSMFYGCTSLVTAPELPATTLAECCYWGMFYGCTSLKAAPELPATKLEDGCYVRMFSDCTSLKAAPELPATTLADGCYAGMFYGCISLQTAPDLPATTLANSCYFSMFYGCSSLVNAPELPATNLAPYCYESMFFGCSSLQTAPDLPATTLANYCYNDMFHNCTSLQTAPDLPATTLAKDCYSDMFNGCSKLNYVKALFETTPSDTYTKYWLSGVSSTGTFVKSKNATWDVRGVNGIPEGWTVEIAE